MADGPDYGTALRRVRAAVQPTVGSGTVAQYIPELAAVPPERFGMAIVTLDGVVHQVGDATERFSIQSISKVFALMLALQAEGDALWKRLGREPSGTPFNSLFQLEQDQGIPRNPFINAGALVVTDVLCSRFAIPENAVAELLQRLCGDATIRPDDRVARSELAHCDRNGALAYLMRSYGNVKNAVQDVLAAYCRQCAIAMSCVELARAAAFLARRSAEPDDMTNDAAGEPARLLRRHLLPEGLAQRINALMLTCGTYDAAGDFAWRVGLPVKSGVGGGILAVIPQACGVCVWSPGLDRNGNSVAGLRALELLARELKLSVF